MVDRPDATATATAARNGSTNGSTRPYALLRAGFPYFTTLGMRRVTTYCMDIAIGDEGRLFVLCRDDGQGGTIRRTNWDDEDLGTIGGSGRRRRAVHVAGAAPARPAGEPLRLGRGPAPHHHPLPGRHVPGQVGRAGPGPGQLNRPSGIAFDADENIYVADTQNHRVQQFTRDGQLPRHLRRARPGRGRAEHALGRGGGRRRGRLRRRLGQRPHPEVQPPTGASCSVRALRERARASCEGPAGLAVDADGDVYVADRGNHRVQQFDHGGRFVEEFLGDATLSRSGRTYILANPKVLRGREMTALGPSKRLRGPAAVRLDGEGRTVHPGLRLPPHPGLQEGGLPPDPGGHLAGAEAPFLYNV